MFLDISHFSRSVCMVAWLLPRSVGAITLSRIEATVFETGFDVELPVMSRLNRVEMTRDGADQAFLRLFRVGGEASVLAFEDF